MKYLAILILAASFVGCGSTFQCKEGLVKLTGHPDGSAKLVAPCDNDPEAVVIEWKKFTGLHLKDAK